MPWMGKKITKMETTVACVPELDKTNDVFFLRELVDKSERVNAFLDFDIFPNSVRIPQRK